MGKMIEVGLVNGSLVGSVQFTEEELKRIAPMFNVLPVTVDIQEPKKVPEVDEYGLRVREVIKTHLKALDESLGDFEQTCHGSGYHHHCGIDALIEQLGITCRNPTPYNVSELSQRIGGFLKVTE